MGHGEAEFVHGDGEIGDHEEHGAQAGGQLSPRPQVVGQLQACHRPPAHEADQADVHGHQVGEGSGEVGVQEHVAEGGDPGDDQARSHVEGLHPEGGRVEDVGDGEHQEAWRKHSKKNVKSRFLTGFNGSDRRGTRRMPWVGELAVSLTVDEVALLLPDEKGVAQSGEDEARQDLPRAGVSAQEAEAVRQQEDPQAEDGQTFDQGAEPGGAGGGQPQNKVHAGGLEERHQLGSFTFDLKTGERPG